MTQRRIVVTGAGGFIGRHVTSSLRESGFATVGIGHRASGDVDVLDDLEDAHRLRQVLEDAEAEAVVHCAWTGHPRQSAHDFSGQLSSNVLTTANVGLAAGLAGVRQVVFISTGGAGHKGTPEHPPPAYGWAKMAAEHVLTASAESFGTVLTVLRPTAVYGPGQDPRRGLGAITVFADRMLRGQPLEVFGSLEQSRDFLHVRDLAEAVVRCLSSGVSGVFPIGGPSEVTVGSVISLLQGAADCVADVRIVPVTGLDRNAVRLDNAELAAALEWAPRTTVASSIGEVLDDVRSHIEARKLASE